MSRRAALATAVLGLTAAVVLLPAAPAAAHPLGNFTVNHADALLLDPDGVTLLAVVDRAEIPTAQRLLDLAPGGDPDQAVLDRAADDECAALARDVVLTVDGRATGWEARRSALTTVPGTAGLPTLRLECDLRAAVDLGGPRRITFRDDHLDGQLGWREVTADGDGVRLLDSPVPVVSPTDGLRSYPEELLADPIDVRSLEVAVEPGENGGGGALPARSAGDPFSSALAGLDRRLTSLVGDDGLSPVVGALAIGLAVLLGCGHALLPGHGKTVMAAYLAGSRGRPRDAVLVGVTVTVTHTVGVLLLGLAVSVSSAFAGDQVLRWLGVASGVLVAGIGLLLLRAALRERRGARPAATAGPVRAPAVPALAGLGAGMSSSVPVHDHGHPHGHSHAHHHAHPHAPGAHTHGPARGGLVGMGVAGGLVPSPSALLVLLASVGLGRTVFGVLLVVAYGLGMAGTLTAVGLLLVRAREGLAARLAATGPPSIARWLVRAAPLLTAVLVVVVGVGLVVRGAVLGG